MAGDTQMESDRTASSNGTRKKNMLTWCAVSSSTRGNPSATWTSRRCSAWKSFKWRLLTFFTRLLLPLVISHRHQSSQSSNHLHCKWEMRTSPLSAPAIIVSLCSYSAKTFQADVGWAQKCFWIWLTLQLHIFSCKSRFSNFYRKHHQYRWGDHAVPLSARPSHSWHMHCFVHCVDEERSDSRSNCLCREWKAPLTLIGKSKGQRVSRGILISKKTWNSTGIVNLMHGTLSSCDPLLFRCLTEMYICLSTIYMGLGTAVLLIRSTTDASLVTSTIFYRRTWPPHCNPLTAPLANHSSVYYAV